MASTVATARGPIDHRRGNMRLATVLCVYLCLATTHAQAQAPQQAATADESDRPQVELEFSRTESNNLFAQGDATRGTYDTVGVILDVGRSRPRTDLALVADLDFRKYHPSVFPDERLGVLNMLASLDAVPERFSWFFQDDYGDRRTNPFGADSPSNRENYNVFTTGPDASIPLAQRTYLTLSGEYSDREYTETNVLDSIDKTGSVGLLRVLSTTTTVEIESSISEVEYDFDIQGFEIETLLLKYNRELADGAVSAEVGTNELDVSGEKTDSPVFRFAWDRLVGSRSRLIVSANREFTDTGSLLGRGLGGIDSELDLDVLLSLSALESERINLQYELTLSKTFWAIGLGAADEAYDADPTLDNQGRNAHFTLRRRLTSRLNLVLDVDTLRRDFTTVDEVSREYTYRLRLDRQLTRRLSFGLGLESEKREGQDAFDEQSYELVLTYRPSRA
jgi:hypothetical protein